MLLIFSFCDFWWLAWLLPFLLGLLAGWMLWARYKKLLEDAQRDIANYKSEITNLEAKLKECQSRRADLEGDVATMKGRVREMEAEVDEIRRSSKGSGETSSKFETRVADNTSRSGGNAPSTDDAIVSSLAAGASASEGGRPSRGDSGSSAPYDKLKNDNLQIIEGIGPKMESVLKENGIDSWSQLASQSPTDLRDILDKYGDKYRIIDPNSWPSQASKASSGDWSGLISLQKSLDGGRGDTGNTKTDSKLEKMMVRLGLIKRYKQDDLKAVEGIGPKIEQLLHNAGIKTWRALSTTAVSKIQEILDEAGSRYKLADPGTWPKQAEMAADGKWDELKEYQDYLQGGKG